MASEALTFDVLIVGGGPAGISAALWSADLGLSCGLIDASPELGGQLHSIYNPIRNYLGSSFENGADCAKRFRDSLEGRAIKIFPDTSVRAIDPSAMTLRSEAGVEWSGRAIIIATGVRRRRLGVPGEREFEDRGILDSGARDPRQVLGQQVAVVGGGDAALENALILSENAARVYLIHRRDDFSAREEFVSAVRSTPNVDLIMNSKAERFGGEGDDLEFIELQKDTGGISKLDVSRAIVRIGFQPNSDLARGIVEMDSEGYITVDPLGRTSSPSVYAIGDVACKISPTIASAVGSAATAIKSAAEGIRKVG